MVNKEKKERNFSHWKKIIQVDYACKCFNKYIYNIMTNQSNRCLSITDDVNNFNMYII